MIKKVELVINVCVGYKSNWNRYSGNEAVWEATGGIGAELSEKQIWEQQFCLARENSLG